MSEAWWGHELQDNDIQVGPASGSPLEVSGRRRGR
jgi:hypothetical protein